MTELVWPNGTKIEPKRSDPYGPRQSYFIDGSWTRPVHTGTDHYGLDALRSIGAGTVVDKSYIDWAGNQVLVDLGVIDGLNTWFRYCHMVNPAVVQVGQNVKMGQWLGNEGNTGMALGRHLHWEVYRGSVNRGSGSNFGSTVDPRAFVLARLTPKENSKKGRIVTQYSRVDGTANAKTVRSLKPGDSFWLHTKRGVPANNASNLVGGVGAYIITGHVYFDADHAGDTLSLTHWWGKGRAQSAHYTQDFVAGKSRQLLRENVTFQRAVTLGDSVYLKCQADPKNKGVVRVHLLANDALLLD